MLAATEFKTTFHEQSVAIETELLRTRAIFTENISILVRFRLFWTFLPLDYTVAVVKISMHTRELIEQAKKLNNRNVIDWGTDFAACDLF